MEIELKLYFIYKIGATSDSTSRNHCLVVQGSLYWKLFKYCS